MVVGDNKIDDDKKYMLLGGRFAGHVDAAVQEETRLELVLGKRD